VVRSVALRQAKSSLDASTPLSQLSPNEAGGNDGRDYPNQKPKISLKIALCLAGSFFRIGQNRCGAARESFGLGWVIFTPLNIPRGI
jgi:hypothetical protein